MPFPPNKKQVQSFIGMITFLSKFSPRLSELAEPTRELSKHKVPFNWGPEHQQAFTEIKKEISNTPILAYYNPKKQTVLQTDTSIKGLGACLLQDLRPVYFASKALTEPKRGMLLLKLNCLQWPGQWGSFTTFYMPAILSWKLIRNHLKLYCPSTWIKLLQDYSRYLLELLLTILL